MNKNISRDLELIDNWYSDPSGAPLYQRVRDQIKAELIEGIWKPGDPLPTELELGRRFNVSVGTVRHAVLTLVREGLLKRRAGKGTFVARLDPSHSFDRFFLFRSGESGDDFRPEIRLITADVGKCADRAVTEKLQLKAGSKVLSIQRVQSQSGTPVCCHTSYFPAQLVPNFDAEDLTERLYPILEAKYALHIVSAEEFLRAAEADAETAKLLSVKIGSPVIFIERIAYTYGRKVLEYRRTYGRSDKFLYKIQLR